MEKIKTSDKGILISDKISKFLIYCSVFLIPIFFFPFTFNVLDFPKQFLLLILVSTSLFLQTIKFLGEGKLSLNFWKIQFFLIFLILVFGISTLLSKSKTESFFGWPLSVSESFLTLVSLSTLYFLVANIFDKKEIFYLLLLFSISLFLGVIFATFQTFGKFIFPFDFAKVNHFNLVGTPVSLAILVSATLPLIVSLFLVSKRLLKFLFLVEILLFLFWLILVNAKVAWLILALGSIFFVFLIIKRESLERSFIFLPLFFLALSLVFLVLNLRIFSVSFPAEISLSHRLSFEIALKSLKENPIFGTGPATFFYNFLRHKGTTLNNTPFWNFRFLNSSSNFFDLLSTVGILGTLSFLTFIFLPLYFGFLTLTKPSFEKFDFILKMGIFLSSLSFFISTFFYPLNLTLSFAQFFILGIFLNLLSERKKEIFFGKNPLWNFSLSFILVLISISFFLILALSSQRFVAEIFYQRGLNFWREGKIDRAIESLRRSISLNPNFDLYFRDLSQLYWVKADQKIQKGETNIQEEVSQSINFANFATQLNPINVINWSIRAFNYQNLVGIVQGAEDWAIRTWEKAIELEPSNPYYFTQKGIMLLRKGILSQNTEEKNKLFAEAQENFKRAIELKSDYAPAHFQLAMVYYNQGKLDEAISKMEETKNIVPFDLGLAFQLGVAYYQKENYQKAKEELERVILFEPNYANALYFLGLTYDKLGDKEKAIEKFKKVAELNPDVEEVKKIISNLEAGKGALEGILQKVPPKVPIEEKLPEIKE